METNYSDTFHSSISNYALGTKEERGMISFQKAKTINVDNMKGNIMEAYDLPLVTPYLNKISCCSYVPVMPNFK